MRRNKNTLESASLISAVWILFGLTAGGRAHGESPLVSQEQAARNGLERAWFSQVPVDPSRSRVSTWYLYYDQLYAVTDSGIVAALDSATGEQLWSKQIGKPGHAAFGPGANDKYLGVVSGAKLYLLDRHNGRLIWVRSLGSAPSSGPALSRTHAYVALMTGRIEGYKLSDPVAQPWYYQSKGRTMLRPTTTGEVVSWPTTAGYLYVSRADEPGVLFRLETNDDIVTSPAEAEPYLYIASLDGYLYAIHEITGREKWRFSTGYTITSSPAIVGKVAYVASAQPALFALNAETGQELWSVAGVSHFAAQGRNRVYASDRFGNILVIDAKTGGVLSRMRVYEDEYTLVNDQSDRLFIVNDRGLVQCLHEIGAKEPTMYRHPPAPQAAGAAKPAKSTGAAPSAAATPPPVESPKPGVEAPPAAEARPADEPAPDEKPAPAPPENDNPFDIGS
jgi:outer membrane protein assembly factor BamB